MALEVITGADLQTWRRTPGAILEACRTARPLGVEGGSRRHRSKSVGTSWSTYPHLECTSHLMRTRRQENHKAARQPKGEANNNDLQTIMIC